MIIQLSATEESADVQGAADALEALVNSWDTEVAVDRRPTPRRADKDKVVDPVSLAALVLSIPSAVLAVADLADRIEKRRRAKQLVDQAKTIRKTTGVNVFVVLADGRRPLDVVDPDELLAGPA